MMTRLDSGLERAIKDAELQLKQMWVLRARMARMAQSATIGSLIGITAAFGLAGLLIEIVTRSGRRIALDDLDSQLWVALGLITVVLGLSGYLWMRRTEARSGADALEAEIEAVRSELVRAITVRNRAEGEGSAE